MSKYENNPELLKKNYPKTWRLRDPSTGELDPNRLDPRNREPDTWTDLDQKVVLEHLSNQADKILQQSKYNTTMQGMLLDELNKKIPRSYAQYQSEAELNRIFGDTEDA
jgi:hypothetical protein